LEEETHYHSGIVTKRIKKGTKTNHYVRNIGIINPNLISK
jgi:hypothetical protein